MARNRPVIICDIRHIPSSEPNFHQTESFLGDGRSIKNPFISLNIGWLFRRGPVIILIYSDFL